MKRDAIISLGMIIMLLLSCACTLLFSNTTIKLKKEKSSIQRQLIDAQMENKTLVQLFENMVELTKIDKDFLHQEMIRCFPISYFRSEGLFVLFSSRACTSCLTNFMEEIYRFEYDKDNVYFLLEEDNKYVFDECRAEGFNNTVFDRNIFELFDFPNTSNLILLKHVGNDNIILPYETGMDNNIVKHIF